MKNLLGLLLLFVSLCPTMASADPAAEAGPIMQQRVREAVAVLRGDMPPEAVFNDHFLSAVAPAQLMALAKRLETENGRIVAAEDIRVQSATTVRFTLGFERATATAELTLEPASPNRISGFRIGAALPIGDTADKVRKGFATLPGEAGFAVARLGDGAPQMVDALNADRQFAIGSTFKLWVLDALVEDISAGRHRWDEVVKLGPRSLPGGISQTWPKGAPVTVETLATLMISISDNTATDTLIALIGRDRIGEHLRAAGHSDPARTLPLLTTAEAFALKLGPGSRRDAYARAGAAEKARMLDTLDAPALLADADRSGLDGVPVAIDTIEWFASPGEIVRTLDRLRRHDDPRVLAILGTASSLDKSQREAFSFVGYKGGSESGVLNLTWLLRKRSGEWYVVTASWNDSKAMHDGARLQDLASRLIALVIAQP